MNKPQTDCRRCADCCGRDHHWIEDVTDEHDYVCKHCPATAKMCHHCDGNGDEPDTEDPCEDCVGEGVIET